MNGQTNETPAARVEARLRKARIWEKLAGEVAGLGVWEWRDRTWRCSRECLRLLGLARSKAALSHDDWKTSIDPRDREKAQRDLDKALESGAEYESEYRIITPEKEVRWMCGRARVIRGSDGEVQSLLGVLVDITQRKENDANSARLEEAMTAQERGASALSRMVEQLEEAHVKAELAHRSKSEFLATMSHEIRTPLNGVIGLTSLLLETELTTQQREQIEMIGSSGDALLAIINDVLDLSKIEAGRVELEAVEIEPCRLAEEALELVADGACMKGLEVASHVEPDVPVKAIGDPTRMRQVLLNLLSNAVKFTAEGSVTLRVRNVAAKADETTRLRFEVTDSGIGISKEAQQRLFQPFTQADASTTRKYGGTGLGLAICKRFVDMMGGAIGVDSNPGEGATFWFEASFRVVFRACMAERKAAGARVAVVGSPEALTPHLTEELRACGVAAEFSQSGAVVRNAQAALVCVNPGVTEPAVDVASLTEANPGLAVAVVQPRVAADSRVKPGQCGVFVVLRRPLRRTQLERFLEEAVSGAPEGSAAEAGKADATRPPGRLLLAEDNPVNQKVAQAMLRILGYQIDLAQNGLEAVELFREAKYDAVLMDCQMPEMDGFEATRKIREGEGQEVRTPIIALTANAFDEDRELCMKAGMDDYLSKPVRPQMLKDALERWVGGRT